MRIKNDVLSNLSESEDSMKEDEEDKKLSSNKKNENAESKQSIESRDNRYQKFHVQPSLLTFSYYSNIKMRSMFLFIDIKIYCNLSGLLLSFLSIWFHVSVHCFHRKIQQHF